MKSLIVETDSLNQLSVQNLQSVVILPDGQVLSGRHTCFLIMSCIPYVVLYIPLRKCISEMLALKPSFGGFGGIDSKAKNSNNRQ